MGEKGNEKERKRLPVWISSSVGPTELEVERGKWIIIVTEAEFEKGLGMQLLSIQYIIWAEAEHTSEEYRVDGTLWNLLNWNGV